MQATAQGLSDYDLAVEMSLPRDEVELALPTNPEETAFSEGALHHGSLASRVPPPSRCSVDRPGQGGRERYGTVMGR